MKRYLPLFVTAYLLTACNPFASSEKTKTPTDTQNITATQPAEPANNTLEISTAEPPNPAWPTYKIGSEATYPPFEYRNRQSELIGFEIDVIRAVGKTGKFNPQIIFAPLNTWKKSLKSRETHAWASAFTLNTQLPPEVVFSKPFLDNTMVVSLYDSEKNKDIINIDDLQGKKISVSKYYGQEVFDLATHLSGSPENVLIADSIYLSIQKMYTGEADAVLGEDKSLQYFRLKKDDWPKSAIRLIKTNEPPRKMAFIVSSNQTELLAKINQGLDIIMVDGTYNRLVQKWFGKSL